MSLHLHIDPFAGLAGDMFLGACIDLGADLAAIDAALAPLPIKQPYRITIQDTFRHAIRATDLKVVLGDQPTESAPPPPDKNNDHSHNHDHNHDHSHTHDHDHSHDHDSTHTHSHTDDHTHTHDHAIGHAHLHPDHCGYSQIMDMIDHLNTTPRAKQRAQKIVTVLGQAEAAVHGVPIEQVHFHEVGAVDSIIDMLGSAIALELLNVDTISCSPLPIGHGFVLCDHGNMPLPAPATAQALKNVPHFGVDRQGETVTPTGAALAAALTDSFGLLPPMETTAIGYGAGDRDTPDVPNLVRLFLGNKINITTPTPPST